MFGRLIAAAVLAALLAPAGARADWSGDGRGDVLAVAADGRLLEYRGTGTGGFAGGGNPIGSGWGAFTALFTSGDFSGDGRADLLARRSDGALLMYRGDGGSGFVTGTGERIGSGWQNFTALLGPGDWSGDGKADILARNAAGALLMYRGDGDSGFLTGAAEPIGSGWQGFTALLTPGDWSGDGKPDLLARRPDGALLMYRGNGAGGFATGTAEPIGAGWQSFTALIAGGDFDGDREPDILARAQDGALLLYRANGSGGFVSPYPQVGSGWQSLSSLMLIGGPAVPPPPPAPPSAPLPDGRVRLQAGLRCTPPGGLLKVDLKVRRRSGRAAPRVRRVVFYVRGGPRKVDVRRPYRVRLRINRPAGQTGRVYARVVFKRRGSAKLRRKTVSRRFVMCG